MSDSLFELSPLYSPVPGWEERAACAGVPVWVFWDRDGVEAQRVCRSCPVVDACLAAALLDPVAGKVETGGVRAGIRPGRFEEHRVRLIAGDWAA